MRLPLTPSGLTMDRVRSSAIRDDLSDEGVWKTGKCKAAAGARSPQGDCVVYLGRAGAGNLPAGGSAGLLRVFVNVHALRPPAPQGRAHTEKLSPQPHSPLTLGFLKRKASFRPCFTKSTTVPSMRLRLTASTNTRTPRSSKIASPGCGPSA